MSENQGGVRRYIIPAVRAGDAAAQDALVAVMEKDWARATEKKILDLNAALAESKRESELKDREIATLTAAAAAHHKSAQSQEELIEAMCKDIDAHEIVMQDLVVNKVHKLEQALRRSEKERQALQRQLERTVPRRAKKGVEHCAVSSKISKEHIIGTPRKRKTQQHSSRASAPRRAAAHDYSLAHIRIGPEFQAVIPDVVPIDKGEEGRMGELIYAPGHSLELLRQTATIYDDSQSCQQVQPAEHLGARDKLWN